MVVAMIFSMSIHLNPLDAKLENVGRLCRSECQRSVCVNHVSESTKPKSKRKMNHNVIRMRTFFSVGLCVVCVCVLTAGIANVKRIDAKKEHKTRTSKQL